jgi:hypothetical protein
VEPEDLQKKILEALGINPKGVRQVNIVLNYDAPPFVSVEKELDPGKLASLGEVFRESSGPLTVGEMAKIKKGLD